MKLQDDNYCFACGEENPIGLKLKFTEGEDSISTSFIPEKKHQGYMDFMHGGIASTILDEIMARYLINIKNLNVMTAKMELRFKKPVPLHEKIIATSKYVSQEAHFHTVKGELRTEKGILLVSATSVFAEIKQSGDNRS